MFNSECYESSRMRAGEEAENPVPTGRHFLVSWYDAINHHGQKSAFNTYATRVREIVDCGDSTAQSLLDT